MIANASVTSKTVISEPDLLWTNTSSVTTSFPAQTINLPTGYSAFLVEFLWRAQSTPLILTTVYVPFSTTQRVVTAGLYTGATIGGNENYRRIVSANDGSIEFGTNTNNVTNVMIPRRIWGIKYTL